MSETWKDTLSREDELLLACARIELEPAISRRVERLLTADLDWDRLVTRAVRQGIPTLVYHHLRTLDGHKVVAPPVWTTLEQAYRVAGLQAMRQRFEVGRLLDALQGTGVQIIALKGLALSETIYPDPALRPSGDIDLLVRFQDVQMVEKVLQELGYEPDEDPLPAEWYTPYNAHHLVPYRLPGREVLIEVHWDLAPPQEGFSIDVEGLWERAESALILERQVGVLSPVDLLAYLGLHASARSRFRSGLRQLVDVAEVARHYGAKLDWAELAARADRWEAQRWVYLALRVTSELLGATNLDGALSAFQPATLDEGLVDHACQLVLSVPSVEDPGLVSDNLARFLSAPSFGEKLSVLAQILFPSQEWIVHFYGLRPDSKRVLAGYLRYWFKLLRDHSGVLLGLARGDQEAVVSAEAGKQDMSLEQWLKQG
jgi:hypothetical protein